MLQNRMVTNGWVDRTGQSSSFVACGWISQYIKNSDKIRISTHPASTKVLAVPNLSLSIPPIKAPVDWPRPP